MPLYDYKCENGHVFEEVQSWTSDPVATCGDCGTSAT
ncbi:MAG: zinc ribbon domain-containing protein, partial [Chloroflexi bacterium]|nr:zinc ribbon domain-containing protein [Chloroflexota bacterium]